LCLYTHIVVGALAGSAAPSIELAPVFGLGSHILLDYIPHYDFERMRYELLFGGLAFAILAAAGVLNGKALLGAVFAALPDLENLFWKLRMLPEEKKVFPSHSGLIPHGREVGPRNLILQTALAALSILVMVRI
jgi:hypothetical protein